MIADIRFHPLTGCIGARVEAVDFNQAIGDETFAQIRQGLHQYLVLLFSGQDLTPAAHVALGQRSGDLE